ncbi:hypothetical protein RIF29_25371 [Crotalaria pallida]|uniref:AAA+ ATPase domain-containing protein n=1 Tax=Crotalaria pallida TaxID=3830 RepID=A0AAN9ETN6_CROPI
MCYLGSVKAPPAPKPWICKPHLLQNQPLPSPSSFYSLYSHLSVHHHQWPDILLPSYADKHPIIQQCVIGNLVRFKSGGLHLIESFMVQRARDKSVISVQIRGNTELVHGVKQSSDAWFYKFLTFSVSSQALTLSFSSLSLRLSLANLKSQSIFSGSQCVFSVCLLCEIREKRKRKRRMASAAVELNQKHNNNEDVVQQENCSSSVTRAGEGLRQYYTLHIHEKQLNLRLKTHNLNRLQAQRNDFNSKVRMLREELQLLQEPGSYVGEVVKVMGKNKVLVKVHPEGKYVVDIDKSIDITKITPSTRVALRNDSYVLHLVLPSKVDPLVNLMKVEKVPDSTYDMIGGLDQQIKEIKEVIELPIKHPELFESLGIAQPKGVLLYGPPGTGKTLLARAVAHHTDCTFIRVSGSELVQKYIGEGSRMVRELFVMAREHAPSIIFMDEIDSIGSARMESGSGNGDSEVQRTMLELLNQLDGFEASNKIKVLMATNRIDILDQALLRPGRIDRKIEFPNPNEESRLDILKIHSRRMNLMRGIDLKKIAEKMNGASGAELKAVCTEAGMFALRERRVHVTQEDFEMAVAKVMKKETEKNMSLRKLWK